MLQHSVENAVQLRLHRAITMKYWIIVLFIRKMEINSESNEMYMWLECIYEMVFRAGAFISSPLSEQRQTEHKLCIQMKMNNLFPHQMQTNEQKNHWICKTVRDWERKMFEILFCAFTSNSHKCFSDVGSIVTLDSYQHFLKFDSTVQTLMHFSHSHQNICSACNGISYKCYIKMVFIKKLNTEVKIHFGILLTERNSCECVSKALHLRFYTIYECSVNFGIGCEMTFSLGFHIRHMEMNTSKLRGFMEQSECKQNFNSNAVFRFCVCVCVYCSCWFHLVPQSATIKQLTSN